MENAALTPGEAETVEFKKRGGKNVGTGTAKKR